jgi:hypothetical protein
LRQVTPPLCRGTSYKTCAGTASSIAASIVQRPSGIGDAAGIADNLDLSSRRAANVVAYFSAHRVDPNLLSAKGFGAARPIAANDTPHRAAHRIVGLKSSWKGSAPDGWSASYPCAGWTKRDQGIESGPATGCSAQYAGSP